MEFHANQRGGLLAYLVIALAAVVASQIHAQALVPLVVSDFEINAEGWRGTNTGNGSETLSYQSGGAVSNSAGYISVSETGGDGQTMHFSAPAKFLGDKRAAYNGMLRFSLKQSETSNLYQDWDVLIRSTNMTLGYRFPKIPGTNWAVFEVPLNENVGLARPGVGTLATREEVLAVLADVTSIWIRAEYSSNNYDRTDLDDVQLLAQPSGPSQANLSLATYAGIAIEGAIGRTYRIEYRTSLDPNGNWQQLTNVVLSSSPHLFVDQSSSSASVRFYRAVLAD